MAGRGEGFHGKQGLDYFSGISAGSKAICMHLLAHAAGCGGSPNEQDSVVLLK